MDRRFLGLDYGEKNVGVALSDLSRRIASPHAVLRAEPRRNLLLGIREIVAAEDVGAIVLGLPLEMSGREGRAAAKARAFAALLRAEVPGVDVVLADERLTSGMSERMLVREFDMSREKRGKIIDKLAAREILQQALDIMNRE
ncbi:MAG: Holliday junction resolvase RuvX [Rickettsiales bacterium]|nr:Holliday junction resolvase RuvX [Rickettsiales bacterium]